jgi:type I restriction enzyme, S subunit
VISEYQLYPAYKDSGVPWLAQVPAHWEVVRLKWVATLLSGGTPSKDDSSFWQGDIPWVSPKDMKAPVINDTEDHISAEGVAAATLAMVPADSVLVVVRSGILRHTLPVALSAVPLCINQDLKALLPAETVNAPYLAYTLTGLARVILVECRKLGATVDSIEVPLLA